MPRNTNDIIADAREQGDRYTPECFHEDGGKLYISALWGEESQNSEYLLIGDVVRQGWDAKVEIEGEVVARNTQNTGWGLIPSPGDEEA